MSILSAKLKIAEIPSDMNIMQIIGVAVLAGLGFTMSIFISNLAFNQYPNYVDSAKIGILIASILAGILGFIILKFSTTSVKNN